MKKRRKSISVSIPPIRLYLEDIKKIEEVYKEHFETFKIITEDFEFDSVEDLKKLEKYKLSSLSFESSEPYIHVDLSRSNARIYSSNDDAESVGIVTKLKNILEKRITPLKFLLSNWIAFILIFLLISSNIIYSIFYGKSGIFILISFCSYLILNSLWSILGWRLDLRKYSMIYLTNRISRRNFFSRNKDQIILAGISAILGSIATFFVLWLAKQLK